MDVLKTTSIDTAAYSLSVFIAMLNPAAYTIMWICLIIVSKTMFSHESRRASDYLRALAVAAPIGVLASLISQEHGLSFYTSIGVGAITAIVSDQIFKGDWFRTLADTLIDAIKSRIEKK
jgi:TctA family transporter